MRSPRLFLLDGLALAYRSHFAFVRRPLVTSRGEHTSALFAFANMVIQLRQVEAPDYWWVRLLNDRVARDVEAVRVRPFSELVH